MTLTFRTNDTATLGKIKLVFVTDPDFTSTITLTTEVRRLGDN